MESATLSDPLLHGILISGIAAAALSVVLLCVILLLRLRLLQHDRTVKAILDHWRPLLTRAAAGDSVNVNPANDREAEFLLPLWSQLRESVRGEAELSLDAFAHHIGLYRTARTLLASTNARLRLTAINTLGHVTHRAAENAAEIEPALRDL